MAIFHKSSRVEIHLVRTSEAFFTISPHFGPFQNISPKQSS